jgi:hypothetical protein
LFPSVAIIIMAIGFAVLWWAQLHLICVAVCRPKYDSYPNYSQLKLIVVETPGLHTMLDG